MANLNINIPDNLFSELSNIASQLKQTPEQCLLLALNHFIKTDTVENAIEGIARAEDSAALVDFPEFKEEVGIALQLHPLAMDELETLELEDQMEVLGQLIERISGEKEDEESTPLDLDLREQATGQLKLSGFSFGDIIYQIGQNITIYHIALLEDDMDEDFDDEDDMDEEVEGEEDFLIEDEIDEEERSA